MILDKLAITALIVWNSLLTIAVACCIWTLLWRGAPSVDGE